MAAARGRQLEQLRQQALAHPADAAVLRVYADALLEAGDALGEFIHAQQRDPDAEVPYAVLRSLLGPLHGRTEHVEVLGGALRVVRLARVTPRELRRLTGRAEWEGVTTLSFARGPTARTRRLPALEAFGLLTHPVCRGLREVLDLDDETFRRLADCERSYERVGLLTEANLAQPPVAPLNLRLRVLEVASAPADQHRLGAWLLAGGRRLLGCALQLVVNVGGAQALRLLPEAGHSLARLEGPDFVATREGGRWAVVLRPPAHEFEGSLQAGVLGEAISAAAGALASLEVHAVDRGWSLSPLREAGSRVERFSLVVSTAPPEWDDLAPF